MPHSLRALNGQRLSRRTALTLFAILSAMPLAIAQSQESDDGDALLEAISKPWVGDLDGIIKRGVLRLATAYDPVMFHYDGPDQRGLVADGAAQMQEHLRKSLGKAARNLTVVVVPLPRDRLIPALLEGQVDTIAASLTITPDREALVRFSDPTEENISEIVVTGPATPEIATLDDLAKTGLHLRPSSSYYEHVQALNAERTAAGLDPIPVTELDENLEDADILELVSVGVLPLAVIDDHMARVWVEVFDGLTLREDLVLNSGGKIAMAMRPDAPQLLAAVNGFLAKVRKGTALGNILRKRYFQDTDRIRNALEPGDSQRLHETIEIIRKYAAKYEFDAILIAAQGFQKSRLDQSKRSKAGAIGIMQVMPATARDPNVNIPDITTADRNVEAGVKYLRFLRDHYFDDPAISPLDQTLLSFAAYNAGPGNIRKARRRAEKMGLDPNRWFGAVEIATARAVSREPVIYVRNILKYYVTYSLFADREKAASP